MLSLVVVRAVRLSREEVDRQARAGCCRADYARRISAFAGAANQADYGNTWMQSLSTERIVAVSSKKSVADERRGGVVSCVSKRRVRLARFQKSQPLLGRHGPLPALSGSN